jgi:hypothetical protein
MVDCNFVRHSIIVNIWIGVHDNDSVRLDYLNIIFDLYFDLGI